MPGGDLGSRPWPVGWPASWHGANQTWRLANGAVVPVVTGADRTGPDRGVGVGGEEDCDRGGPDQGGEGEDRDGSEDRRTEVGFERGEPVHINASPLRTGKDGTGQDSTGMDRTGQDRIPDRLPFTTGDI